MVYAMRTNKPLVTKKDIFAKRKRIGDWKKIDDFVNTHNVSIDKNGNVNVTKKNA